jgi:Ca-activated chloride channel family protein
MHANSRSTTWQDVAAFISLAAAAGLACGIALGGIALLLSAPAYGAEPEGTLVLRPLQPELDPHTAIRAMPVSTEAGFRIDEGMAEARVVQTFRNPASVSYDGIYAMTLPQDAAVERLRVRVGERILDLDPAEIVTSSLLALEIKDIGPLQAVVVEVDYVKPLTPTSPRRPVSTAL